MSRASHYRRTSKAAQRNGVAKGKTPARDTDTVWIPEFVSSIQGLDNYFTADSIIAASLGDTAEERMLKLRELARRGILHMTAYREDGEFVEFRFVLTDRGTL
jgi:hypothetical protein